MPAELIVLIAALIVTFLVFTWLIKVVKATIQTAITIALIVLILQLIFGIGPSQLWQKIIELPQIIWQQPNQ
ncbi:hypothetical protein NIES2119_18460 [[Phormidium ambiguum] IAM M-71]|uniref:AI-2E family transporter n=1 Tax=[Phormidium ambiguum] IAM M-71 TaxID=454136 RepID=A0A1U7IG68_9CYAN|nr:hypothetical protein [Phormidium ambiguum]OKH35983.1 hypothetical protein NIES2119_18460 [Phormidium ambiguum IAM M-71]